MSEETMARFALLTQENKDEIKTMPSLLYAREPELRKGRQRPDGHLWFCI
jgi:hypothetical protein